LKMQKEIKEIESALKSLPEQIEHVIYKNGDDIAVSIGRSFERLEERIDAAETRISTRLTDIADEIGTELKTLRLLVEDASEVVIAEK
jgi:hypothetical protein